MTREAVAAAAAAAVLWRAIRAFFVVVVVFLLVAGLAASSLLLGRRRRRRRRRLVSILPRKCSSTKRLFECFRWLFLTRPIFACSVVFRPSRRRRQFNGSISMFAEGRGSHKLYLDTQSRIISPSNPDNNDSLGVAE